MKRMTDLARQLTCWAMAAALLLALVGLTPGLAPEAKAYDCELPPEAAAVSPCTGNHTDWTAINSWDALKTQGTYHDTALPYLTLEGGSYYLTADIETDASILFLGNVRLCLNGHTLRGVRTDAYYQNSFISVGVSSSTTRFDLCDCAGGGKIQSTLRSGSKLTGQNAYVIMVVSTATLNFFGGSICDSYGRYGVLFAGGATAVINMYEGASVVNNDGIGIATAVELQTNAQFHMFGGEISGNTGGTAAVDLYSGSSTVFDLYGGTVQDTLHSAVRLHVAGATFNMYGGRIGPCAATATNGAIYLEAQNTTFNMYGGSFAAGYNQAVKLAAAGAVFNMYDGEIRSVRHQYYGSIHLAADDAVFNLYGGTLAGNVRPAVLLGQCCGVYQADGDGKEHPNQAISATFNMYGGLITGNTTFAGVYVGYGSSTVNLYGGEISGNTNASGGGGVYAIYAPKALRFYGTTITGNSSTSTLDIYTASQVRLASNGSGTVYYGGVIGQEGDAAPFWKGRLGYPVFVDGARVGLANDATSSDPTVYSDDHVAYDGATRTLTVKDAVDGGDVTVDPAYQTLTVKLDCDWTTDTLNAVAASQDLTIDVNGHTFTVTDGPIVNAGTLTLIDTSAEQTGAVVGEVSGEGALNDPCYLVTERPMSVTAAPSASSVQPGGSIDVVLTLADNNAGVASGRVVVTYDPSLTLTAIADGTALNGLTFTPPGDLTANPFNLFWSGPDAVNGTGTLATLTFTVSGTAAPGQYAVTLTCEDDDFIDDDLNDLPILLNSCAVTVSDQAADDPGDLSGDGKINAKDIVLLQRFVAGGYSVELTDAAADLNKDGKVNAKDIVLLQRFVAGGYGVTLS